MQPFGDSRHPSYRRRTVHSPEYSGTSMAVSGLFVTPGTLTNLDPSSEIGNGLSVTKDGIIALKSGVLVENDGLWDISDHSPGVNTLQIGDDIIGEVHNLQPKVAIIRIISVEKEGMQEKSLSAQQLFADITVTELCDRFMPSAGDAMRRRDIIRARVTSTEPLSLIHISEPTRRI